MVEKSGKYYEKKIKQDSGIEIEWVKGRVYFTQGGLGGGVWMLSCE